MYPNLSEEKKLWHKGYKLVVGLDEAGRGPIAGPVTAAAATVRQTPKFKIQNSKVKDSKQLSPKQREIIYQWIIGNPNIRWGIGIVSQKVIDKINILEATKLAMTKAIKNLKAKSRGLKVGYLILDGKMRLELSSAQKSIVKADAKVFSCAAASILAKVTRDRIMLRYHKKYPRYRFDLHKGYPTKLHIKLLKKYGPSGIHRLSFRPVKIAQKNQITKSK
jgi:ribonuclease HII